MPLIGSIRRHAQLDAYLRVLTREAVQLLTNNSSFRAERAAGERQDWTGVPGTTRGAHNREDEQGPSTRLRAGRADPHGPIVGRFDLWREESPSRM
jgi:hypothetical protein